MSHPLKLTLRRDKPQSPSRCPTQLYWDYHGLIYKREVLNNFCSGNSWEAIGRLSSKLSFYYQTHTHFMHISNDVQDEQSILCSVSSFEVTNPPGFDYPFQAPPQSVDSFNIPLVPRCMTSSLTMCTK